MVGRAAKRPVPTIEMRIADICTRLEDGVTVAAMFVSILSMLFRRRRNNQRWRTYANMLVAENVWRAQRYGVAESLVDYGRGELVSYPDLVEELIELVSEDAEELGCVAEVEGARTSWTAARAQTGSWIATTRGWPTGPPSARRWWPLSTC